MALFLALYLAAFNVRPLAVTLLYGVRTFLPLWLTPKPAIVWPASGAIVTVWGANLLSNAASDHTANEFQQDLARALTFW